MALPALIQAIQARFRGSNNNAYSSTANPLGLGQGGQRQNFPPRLKDVADTLDWIAGAIGAIDADASATAADRIQTGQDLSNTHLDVVATAQNVLAAASEVTKAKTEVSNAKAQAEAAAALYDLFDDRFLGARAADPTTDNDGNPLAVGAIVFNTTAGTMKVWTGSAWQVFVPAAADYLLKSGGTLTGLLTFAASQFATKAQAEAGTDAEKLMTAQRVAEAIAKLSPQPGLSLISSQSVSSAVANVDITLPVTAYDNFQLVISELVFSAAVNGAALRVSTDGGASFISANGSYACSTVNPSDTGGGTVTTTVNSGIQYIQLSQGSNFNVLADSPVNLVVDIFRPALTNRLRSIVFRGSHTIDSTSKGNPVLPISGAARLNNVGKIDALRVFPQNAANIVAGKFDLYGYKKQ